MNDFIRVEVASGFGSEDDIVRAAVEVHADETVSPVLLQPIAERVTREAWAKHLREQANWPPVTDCDRLNAAFDELDSNGVVSRQNFSDCGTCGVSEIADEMDAASAKGHRVRGYTFFHVQDTEAAVRGDGVYLNYGAVEDTEASALAIAREIVATLTKHGLKVSWDGTWSTRIAVILEWKRRR